eukprot:473983-Pelagomonas_calceolata.AAC.1
MTNPNPGSARKLPYPSITGIYKLLQSLMVWNTAARVHLNNQNHTWLQDLAKAIPEAKWIIKNVSNYPIRNTRHILMLGIGKCEKLPLGMKQISRKALTSRARRCFEEDFKPCLRLSRSHLFLQGQVSCWNSWE